ncbi:MAG: hypothetical protein RBT02_07455 [Bacteroidales bacterium]|jgi:hypothetical protein|nr:hypothetical protein [Bacteroidales bacterium]
MKINFRRFQVLALLVMAALLLPVALMGQGTKTNFSGRWVYNADKSNTGQPQGQTPAQGQGQRHGGQARAGMGGSDFTAKQDGNNLIVETTMKAPDGTSNTVTTMYTLDSKECINRSRGGDSKSVATWSSDGSKLTIKTTRTVNRGGETRTISSTEVWSLTDPETLTVEMTRPSPRGERKMTSVYIKK